MAGAKDILFNDEGFEIKNGDFNIQLSDNMHIEHLLKSHRGHYYQNPLTGIGINSLLKSPVNITKIKQDIRLQLESDGMVVRQLDVITNGESFSFDIDAERKIK